MKYSGFYTGSALRYIQVSMYMSYGIFLFRIHMSNGIYQPRVINATWTGVLTEVKQWFHIYLVVEGKYL